MRFLQRERLPHHSNGMRFAALDAAGETLDSKVYYSIGGGAIVDEGAIARNAPPEGAWDIPTITIRPTSCWKFPRARASASPTSLARTSAPASRTRRSTGASMPSSTPCPAA
jgi:hypothetical protein